VIAADDIVRSFDEVEEGAREPLLVLDPLLEFLDAHGLGSGDAEVEPIGEGHSNVSFGVTRGDLRLVLRRPPRGPLPPSAHDVLREARVQSALAGRVPVAEVLAVCEDPGVIGAPFYVMARLDGVVMNSGPAPSLAGCERETAEAMVDALAELHAVDWRAAGLEGFGRPDGYLERQLARFAGLWEKHRTRDVPAMERIHAWLAAGLPESPPATIVHGDFRLGNVMFAPEPPPRVAAIFDWEMSTIGDPLADLGYLLTFWVQHDDPDAGVFEQHAFTRAQGWPTRDELLARYAARSGRTVQDAPWYRVLALWKIIVFMEGNYRRALAGSVDDPYLTAFGEAIEGLADRAEALTR
jgi:aminoglycoside phosphotransferase (APT) family kinase protein